jgi:hypothetical protein
MPNTDNLTGWTVTAADDDFHVPSNHPWETETFWSAFTIPDRKINGWFYNQVLANQGDNGTCNGGCFLWGPEDVDPYSKIAQGVAMPPGPRTLNDIELPNGNRIKTLEHLSRYSVQYSDKGKFEADLIFEGIMEPNPHPDGVAPFWKGRHFDQAMHVTGDVVLNGERIPIDCFQVRDRSWSPRPPRIAHEANATLDRERAKTETAAQAAPRDGKPKRPRFVIGYIYAVASPRDAFLVYTNWEEGNTRDPLTTGYLIRDGVWAHLVNGERRCVVDPRRNWINHIECEAVDTLGRKLNATGRMVSHQGAKGPGNALFYWNWDGAEGWGENQGGIADIYLSGR